MSNLATRSLPRKPPKCVECGSISYLVVQSEGPKWFCDCGAFVLCRPGTLMPGGKPCNDETRELRRLAHEAYTNVSEYYSDGLSAKLKKQAKNRVRYGAGRAIGLPFARMNFAELTSEQAVAARLAIEAMK